MYRTTESSQTLIIDLIDCCITQNYWQEILKPYWAQNVPTFLAERWDSPHFQGTLADLVDGLKGTGRPAFNQPDPLSVSEQIVRCIQSDQWSKGVPSLLSQMVSLGIGTGYLETQIHVDAFSSLQRWHQRGWCILTVNELSSLAQRQLLQRTQFGDVSTYVSYHIPLSAKLPTLNNCTLISARAPLLHEGNKLGHKTLRLNRSQNEHPHRDAHAKPAQPEVSPGSKTVEILEMDFADLFLST